MQSGGRRQAKEIPSGGVPPDGLGKGSRVGQNPGTGAQNNRRASVLP